MSYALLADCNNIQTLNYNVNTVARKPLECELALSLSYPIEIPDGLPDLRVPTSALSARGNLRDRA
jgi:hypothetical protein